jgi:TspO/MBR family
MYNKIFKFAASIGVCQFAGIIGSVFTASTVSSWYPTLIKPNFSPPSWLFAPVLGKRLLPIPIPTVLLGPEAFSFVRITRKKILLT